MVAYLLLVHIITNTGNILYFSDLNPVLKQVLHIVKQIYVDDESMLNTFLLAKGAEYEQVLYYGIMYYGYEYF